MSDSAESHTLYIRLLTPAESEQWATEKFQAKVERFRTTIASCAEKNISHPSVNLLECLTDLGNSDKPSLDDFLTDNHLSAYHQILVDQHKTFGYEYSTSLEEFKRELRGRDSIPRIIQQILSAAEMTDGFIRYKFLKNNDDQQLWPLSNPKGPTNDSDQDQSDGCVDDVSVDSGVSESDDKLAISARFTCNFVDTDAVGGPAMEDANEAGEPQDSEVQDGGSIASRVQERRRQDRFSRAS